MPGAPKPPGEGAAGRGIHRRLAGLRVRETSAGRGQSWVKAAQAPGGHGEVCGREPEPGRLSKGRELFTRILPAPKGPPPSDARLRQTAPQMRFSLSLAARPCVAPRRRNGTSPSKCRGANYGPSWSRQRFPTALEHERLATKQTGVWKRARPVWRPPRRGAPQLASPNRQPGSLGLELSLGEE